MDNQVIRLLGCFIATAIVAGCGAVDSTGAEPTGNQGTEDSSAHVVTSTIPLASSTGTTATSTTAPDSIVEGMFDVGGHELHLRCAGTGSPTVVYLHGAIFDSEAQPVSTARRIEDQVADSHRFCAYDRRNVGKSDTVDAEQTPDDLMNDMRALLDAAGVEPPYVLLGASFGGLFAYVYANTYPDEVVGMVLLDSLFPDELSLEHLFPFEEQYEAFDDEDKNESVERISHFRVMSAAQEFIGEEPAIPVTYLASEQEPWDQQDYGIPEYDSQIIGLLEAYVGRFSPGELVWVDSPHFMEPVIPDVIADSLRTVIERTGES